MKRFLLKAAGVCAVIGVVLCVAGFLLGGKLVGINIGRNGLSYSDATMQELLSGQRPIFETDATPDGAPADPAAADESAASAQSGSVPTNADAAGLHTFDGVEIHSLDVELGGAQAYLRAGDRWSVTVENTGKYTTVVKEGVLNVTCREDTYPETAAVVTITCPQDAFLREADIELGAGTLTVDRLVCSSLELDVGAGSAVLNDIEAGSACDISVGAGWVELNGTLSGENSIDCGMGEVICRLTAVDRYDFEVDCGMGSVVLDENEFSGLGAQGSSRTGAAVRYDIDCGMGSVEITHG